MRRPVGLRNHESQPSVDTEEEIAGLKLAQLWRHFPDSGKSDPPSPFPEPPAEFQLGGKHHFVHELTRGKAAKIIVHPEIGQIIERDSSRDCPPIEASAANPPKVTSSGVYSPFTEHGQTLII